MTLSILQERLAEARPRTAEEQDYVLREMLQEVTLSGLARKGFFKEAAFHGGSSLRILHGLRRFSEDLDFLLKKPDPGFGWQAYAEALREEFQLYQLKLEIKDRVEVKAIRTLFLKDESLGKLLQLTHPIQRGRKLTIKLEIDSNPPRGSAYEIRYVNFPVPFSLLTQDLASGFAMKLHALLCRSHVKGRDWFDFLWYLARHVQPNWKLLNNALAQQGPWAGTRPRIDASSLPTILADRIRSLPWEQAKTDVERFLEAPDRKGLDVWGADFFLQQLEAWVP